MLLLLNEMLLLKLFVKAVLSCLISALVEKNLLFAS